MRKPRPELDRLNAVFEAMPFDVTQPVSKGRSRLNRFADLYKGPADVTVAATTLGNCSAERLTANDNGPVILYLHGGGYVTGSPTSHRHLTSLLAREVGGVVYALDYRKAPESPYPAAVEDALTAWRELAARYPAQRCAIAGDSAGGGLAFTTLVQARGASLALPACIVALSPWVNLGTDNPSYDRLQRTDKLLSRAAIDYYVSKYVPGRNVREPGISPLFADLSGLPPTLIQVGDHESFFGDACAMHEALIAAGVDTELSVWKEMFHVWHLHWPALAEGRVALEQAAKFISACSST